MFFVKALVTGPKDHAPIDPVRHDRLPLKRDGDNNLVRGEDGKPVGLWRQVERSSYWARMMRDGGVAICDSPAPEDVEGYEPPAVEAEAAAKRGKGE